MKKKLIFRGTATALITPFAAGSIDYPALDRLMESQIDSGIDALVIGGTTGEAATLSDKERYTLYRHAVDRIAGRTKVILGVGTNDTRAACRHTRTAAAIGCDGVLSVTPYYNKGPEDGIVRHYLAQAEAADIPLLLYNVPGRTGVNLTTRQLDILADCENIVGLKEAGDSVDRLMALAAFGDRLPLYAGNDSQIYTVLSLGGHGVISVASNAFPRAVGDVARLYAEGRHAESRKKQLSLMPLVHALFAETNPTPIKYLMYLLGRCRPDMRLPLALPKEETRALLRPFSDMADT